MIERRAKYRRWCGRGRGIYVLAAIVYLCATAENARGSSRMMAEDAVDWATLDADVIVRGVITDMQPIPGLPQQFTPWDLVTVRVVETIKGPQAETVRFSTIRWRDEQWKTGERVFLLKTFMRSAVQWVPSREMAVVVAACPLTMRDVFGSPIATAAKHPWPIYDVDLHPMDDPDEIMDALRREVRNPPTVQNGYVEVMIAPSVAGARVGGPGVIHFVNVLFDARMEERAKRWLTSASEYDRFNAARVLGRVRTPANIAALKKLLNDPFHANPPWPYQGADEHTGFGGGVRTLGPYPVRRAAFEALGKWQAAPAHAILFEPKYPTIFLGIWAVVAVVFGFGIIVFGVMRSKWFAPVRRWVGGFGAMSLLMVLLTLALWMRGYWRIDEIAWHPRREIVSMDGEIRVVNGMMLDYDAAPPSLTSVSRTPATEADWAVPPYPGAIVARSEWLGFAIERVVNSSNLVSAWTVPLWAVCVVFGVLPAIGLIAAVRRHRLKEAGLCVECGYDLRASPTRCPECGAYRKGGNVTVRD